MRLSFNDMQAPEFLKDRYSRFELLGSGGMGMVYGAFDETLQKEVAIKLLPGQKLTPERAMRFQQEARSASKLKHPNLVTILDFGISPQGEPFLIMDYAGGTTLDQIVGEGGVLDPHRALLIVLKICEGIKHAHANGIIHRDLKPSNIMVAYDDSGAPAVTVLDFGIAKAADGELGKGLTLTPQGGLIGTPYYMSPEQISGESVDARSDIYSIGCLLFALLAGRAPFQGDTAIEAMQKARSLRAPSIHDVNPDIGIPSELEESVAKALMKNPADRQQTIQEFQNELHLSAELLEERARSATSDDTADGGSAAAGVRDHRVDRHSSIPANRKLRRGTLVAILIGSATLVTLTAFGFMALAPTETIPSQVPNGSTEAADVNNDWSVLKRSKGKMLPIVGGTRSRWETHFEKEHKDGVWTYRARETMTDDDLRQLADQHVEIYALNLTVPSIAITPRTGELISRLPLKQLDCSNSKITDECLRFIGRMKDLKKVELSDTDVSDKGIEYLRDLKNLEIIQLSKTRITDKSMDILKGFNHLTSVEFHGLPLTDGGIAKLKDLPIIDIDLMECSKITDKVFESLAESGRLHTINASQTPLTDKALVCLRSCKKLEGLDLSDCKGVTDSGVEFICNNLSSIVRLDVSGTSITGKSIQSLVARNRLEDLSIAELKLTDRDLEPLKNLSRLRCLEMSANRITDRTLQALSGLPALETIKIDSCPDTTSDGIEQFRALRRDKFHKDVTVKRMNSDYASSVETLLGAGGLLDKTDQESENKSTPK